MIVKLADIKVDPRQREDYGDLEDLANSMADPRFGQLQNIVLDRGHRLLAGGRRFAAAGLLAINNRSIAGLGVGEIKAEYTDVLDPLHSQLIELEENVRRKQLEWKEEQKAIATMHRIKLATEPMWNAEKTAALIGLSKRTVYNALELSEAVDKHEDVAKAETPHGAMQRLTRIKQLKERQETAVIQRQAMELGMTPKIKAEIVNMDALEGLRQLPDRSVDLVIMNPPFGVDIEDLFTSGKHIYADEPTSITELVDRVVEQAYRVLKDDRWLVMFYPTARLEDVKGIGQPMWERIVHILDGQVGYIPNNQIADLKEDLEHACGGMLRRHGFTFSQVPAIWYKPNKRVSSLGGDTYAKLNIQYESLFFARKGKPIFHTIPPGNVFVCDTPGPDRIHPLEMPVGVWDTILRACAVGGERVVEPFAGSGSGGEAAINRGCDYLGWELDPEFALRGNTRLIGRLAAPPKVEKVSLADQLKQGLVKTIPLGANDDDDLFEE